MKRVAIMMNSTKNQRERKQEKHINLTWFGSVCTSTRARLNFTIKSRVTSYVFRLTIVVPRY